MKKAVFILFLIPVLLFSGCFLFKNEAQELVQKDLGLDISDATVNLFLNTRKESKSGITVLETEFPDDRFSSQLSADDNFQELPVGQALVEILESIDLLKNENGELMIPYADNGYYRIELLTEKGQDLQATLDNGAELLFAIYNRDTNKFHYTRIGIDNLNLLAKLQELVPQQS